MSSEQPNPQAVTLEVDISSSTDQQRRQPQAEPQVDSTFLKSLTRVRDSMLDRPIQYDILSIIFSILILLGGLIGYFTKGSVPSLISGIVFFVLLAIGTYLEGARKFAYPLIVTLIALGAMMLWRYTQTYNFLPAGLFALLTFIMLLRHCYIVYLRRQNSP